MANAVLSILILMMYDLVFVALVVLALMPLFWWKRAAYAVLKRNFVSYFSNPTGYVFLCLFVLLTSFAAFWPHEFFSTNLANLDQLNLYLPFIMLVFIPAITMSIWAEERRQGTDELLLTLPADDFDIVIGKYLAAAAVFTVSLMFSQLSNFAVLASLTEGNLDLGLMLATYFGYWLVGLAMIAVGMVASFLTGNLTVGFILGAVFNAPLAFAARADVIVPSAVWSRRIAEWSYTAQFDDFGRGVFSVSSLAFFAMLVVVGLYLSMVLIGKRHWMGGRDGSSMFGHYLARIAAMLVIALSVTTVFANADWVRRLRMDATEDKISSLSPDTKRLLNELEPDHPIYIDAFVSADVPDQYVETRYSLLTMLKEFSARAGDDVVVRVHDELTPYSEEAVLAQERYGIEPREVTTEQRGVITRKKLILGAAFSSGLEKVVVPFFDYGIPVEYELIRSITTVAQGERKKLGVLNTQAQPMGGFAMSGGQPQRIPKLEVIAELEKQYDIEQVDPSSAIDTERYDALLAVQPSSLDAEGMKNLSDAIAQGLPTAIFEDPGPTYLNWIAGTGQANQQQGMFGGGQNSGPPTIYDLWDTLGMEMIGDQRPQAFDPKLVWQLYNPHRKLDMQLLGVQWVFVRNDMPQPGDDLPFANDSPITEQLTEVLFPQPGGLRQKQGARIGFEPLVTTGKTSGAATINQFRQYGESSMLMNVSERKGDYVLAAQIRGRAQGQDEESIAGGAGDEEETSDQKPAQMNVVYVADVDVLSNVFASVRAQPSEELDFRFDNVPFVLNIVDVLAGDDRFIEVRNRKTQRRTLEVVEQQVAAARDREVQQQLQSVAEYETAMNEFEARERQLTNELNELQEQLRLERAGAGDVDRIRELNEKIDEVQTQLLMLRQRRSNEETKRKNELDEKIDRIRRLHDLEITKMQNEYKFWAVVLPPIPPLLVGLVVFVRRRLREREGISKSRMRV